MTKFKTARVYSDPDGQATTDGYRVFVDRLWPRGESKAMFHYDLWAKDVAPSTPLRQWFHADPQARWEEFRSRYMAELGSNPAAAALADRLRDKPLVTLLYSFHDSERNNALVLADYLAKTNF